MRTSLWSVVFVLSWGTAFVSGQISNSVSPVVADVLKLQKAQVGENVIVAFIQNSPRVSLSADDVLRLQSEGLSSRVLVTLLNPAQEPKSEASAESGTGDPAKDQPASTGAEKPEPAQPAQPTPPPEAEVGVPYAPVYATNPPPAPPEPQSSYTVVGTPTYVASSYPVYVDSGWYVGFGVGVGWGWGWGYYGWGYPWWGYPGWGYWGYPYPCGGYGYYCWNGNGNCDDHNNDNHHPQGNGQPPQGGGGTPPPPGGSGSGSSTIAGRPTRGGSSALQTTPVAANTRTVGAPNGGAQQPNRQTPAGTVASQSTSIRPTRGDATTTAASSGRAASVGARTQTGVAGQTTTVARSAVPSAATQQPRSSAAMQTAAQAPSRTVSPGATRLYAPAPARTVGTPVTTAPSSTTRTVATVIGGQGRPNATFAPSSPGPVPAYSGARSGYTAPTAGMPVAPSRSVPRYGNVPASAPVRGYSGAAVPSGNFSSPRSYSGGGAPSGFSGGGRSAPSPSMGSGGRSFSGGISAPSRSFRP
jgi:hypothetical protein